MPVAQFNYTLSPQRELAIGLPLWTVREDNDEYGGDQPAHLALADFINDKLTKAEALSWLLHSTGDCPEHARSITAQVIAEFIREALDAHDKQWDNIRHLNRR